MQRKLTDRFISTVAPSTSGRLEITDKGAAGLVLRVSGSKDKDGEVKVTKTWAVRYRPKGGKQQRVTLGEYSKALPLAKARQRALAIVAAAVGGADLPAEEERQRKRDAAKTRTVGELLTEYVNDYCKPNQRRWKLTERLFDMHVRPHLGSTRLVDLHRYDVIAMLEKLEKAGLRAQVNRTRSQLVAALNWAVETRGYLEANPAASVKRRKGLETPRGRVLSDAELRAIWQAAERIGGAGGAFAKVLTLTGQRRDEVRCMTAAEILPGTADWVLPVKRNKGKRDHLVPLPEAAAAIVRERLNAMARPRGDQFVFTVSGTKPYAGQKRLKEILDRESGVKAWTFHDLRRTCASGMAALHVAQDTIDRVLNHAKDRLAGTYNTHQYRDEKAAALATWAERVAIIVSEGLAAPNVVELRPGA